MRAKHLSSPDMLPEPTRQELGSRVRRGVASGELRKDSSVEAGGRRFRIVGFDPMGAQGRLVYLESLDTGSRHSLALPETAA